MNRNYWIELKIGHYEFYNIHGLSIYSLNEAVAEANKQYGNEWKEVYNCKKSLVNKNYNKSFVYEMENL